MTRSSSEQLIRGFESHIRSVRHGWSRLGAMRLRRGRGRRYIELNVLSGMVPTVPPVHVNPVILVWGRWYPVFGSIVTGRSRGEGFLNVTGLGVVCIDTRGNLGTMRRKLRLKDRVQRLKEVQCCELVERGLVQ